jgi:hypothetical protein
MMIIVVLEYKRDIEIMWDEAVKQTLNTDVVDLYL